MLTEICQYLKNWFNRKPDGTDYPKYTGDFVIADGEINIDELADGQYFRIIGSLFNDGVHLYGAVDDILVDESFSGSVWTMGVPKAVVQLVKDIEEWQTKYGSAASEAMSPFTSESYAGYSYSKNTGNGNGASETGWQNAFANRLSMWRKI